MKPYYPEAQHFILNERSIEDRPFLGIISLPWSGQTISPKAGICQEIFRDGTYFLSVGPNFKGELPKVHKGDYIYSISLLPRTYGFDGIIMTKDSKQQGYDIHVEMRVANSTRFMEMYHTRQDPARWAFMQFKQAFEYYASRMGEVTEAKLGPWLERQVATFSQACGIQVTHPVWFLHAFNQDQKDATKKEDIEQTARRRKWEIEIEYDLKMHEERLKRDLEREQKEFSRAERAKQNDFARSEQKRKKVLEEQIKLLSSTVNGLIQINNDRVSDSIGYNLPAQAILKDSLRLLASLNNSLDNSSQEAEAIVDTIPSNGMLPADTEEDYGPDIEVYPTASSITATNRDVDMKSATSSEISSFPDT